MWYYWPQITTNSLSTDCILTEYKVQLSLSEKGEGKRNLEREREDPQKHRGDYTPTSKKEVANPNT